MSQEKTRLVVDCLARLPNEKWRMDNSSVFPLEMLDEEHARDFDPSWPWLFDSDELGILVFKTEDDACKAQRDYRRVYGFDPITGERI